MVQRMMGLCFACCLGVFLLPRAAVGAEWAVLGYELGCWSLATVHDGLKDDPQLQLRGLKPFSSPEELVQQLHQLGIAVTTQTTKAPKGTRFGTIVVVEIDKKRSVRFIREHYCKEHNDR